MKKNILTVIAIALSFSVLSAQEELKTKSISVFKNGKSFVIKEGNVATQNQIYTLSKTPNALMGTFWFSGTQSFVKQVISSQEIVDEPLERKVNSFSDLLYANKGKILTITTNDGKTYKGVVEDFSLPEEISSALQLKEKELTDEYGDFSGNRFDIFRPEAAIFSFKMSDKWVAMSPSDIKTIEFADKPNTQIKANIKVKKPVIKVHFDKSGTQGLNMMYLQDGISWNPTYQLNLLSDTQAKLKLQAEVSNSNESIKETDMSFVVGVPNFKYATDPATLVSWTQFVQSVSSRYNNFNTFSNAIIPSQSLGRGYDSDEISPIYNADNESENNEDFYLYTVKNVSLEKGGKAHYPLFETTIPIKHIYECDLKAEENIRGYYQSANYSFDTKYSDVFHSIEIKNTTKNPFTTGAVLLLNGQDQKPLAQDLLTYTGIGQTSYIKLTQVPDIRVSEKEFIVKVEENPSNADDEEWERKVTVQNEITITNSKNKTVDFVLHKSIKGRILKVSEKFDKTVTNAQLLNPSERMTADTPLKANETKKVIVTYQILID